MSNDEILKAIGRKAHEGASALDAKGRGLLLFECAAPQRPVVGWTEYRGGVLDTRDGARRDAPWSALGGELAAYAKRVVKKGSGWWLMGALSTNGRCRDADIEGVTMLILDCDGGGDWDAVREMLVESRMAHIVQRSSSHTTERPKWHLLVPLAHTWTGTKIEWRCVWRFLVGWFSAAAELPCRLEEDPPTYGFDPKTDRLGQPSFPAAKRDSAQPPPETICVEGNALDLESFLVRAGFQRPWPSEMASEPVSSGAALCPPEHGLLALAFAEAGLLRHRIERADARGYAVVCPTEHLHSGARRERDDSTIVFDPHAGSASGYFHCKHRCGNLEPKAALKLLPDEAVQRARHRWREAIKGRCPVVKATTTEARPTIVSSTEEHAVNDQAIDALGRHPSVFQMSGQLVRVVVDPQTRAPRIAPVTPPTLREFLASCARWVRFEQCAEGELIEVPAHPPEWCVRAVAARGEWGGIRSLVGVVEAPALRPDGTLIQQAGYDPPTALLYVPSGEFLPVPEQPTHADAVQACKELFEVVRDFPFATPAHQAAWLALLLTLFARPAINGCVPMAAVDATTRGTGKGKLADATSNIHSGRDASKTPQPKDDEEMRKRITALLLEGEKLIVLDNIARPLGDPSLDACLTATTWKDRALGTNTTVSAPNIAIWIATGNNLQFAGDTARRVLHIRLESPIENPEDREGFAHPDLLGWIRGERPRLVRAALLILRAYFVAGCPDMGCKAWGSFESWSKLIANCTVWVGLPDPQGTRTELEEQSDTARNALSALIKSWEKLQNVCCEAEDGMTVGGVVKLLYPPTRNAGAPPDTHAFYGEARDAIEAVAPTQPGKPPSAQKLGLHIHHARRRVVGGRMFDRVGDSGHVAKWRVMAVDRTAGGLRSSLTPPLLLSPSMPANEIAPSSEELEERLAIVMEGSERSTNGAQRGGNHDYP